MKLVSYFLKNEKVHLHSDTFSTQATSLGLLVKDKVYDVVTSGQKFGLKTPYFMEDFLFSSENYLPVLQKLQDEIMKDPKDFESISEPKLASPVPSPTSCRDGYAFRQHVETMRRNRGLEMAPEFDQFPIFYFTNHNAIVGPGNVICETDHFQNLDFELELACVIGRQGKNISASKADDYVIGYTIMNDFSARILQNEEMKLNLGPAKGKDFATAIGPWLVTKDELESKKISTPDGNQYDLQMKAYHNGKQISDGNSNSMNWTFAQIIERISYGAEIFPGDIIGSGTVGTGCYAELNSTAARIAKEKNETSTSVWLQDGDTIDLEIDGLGVLKNKIIKQPESYSILAKKKNV